MREIALDTETTGLSPKNGDRVVEIGCVELINHMPTGRTYQTYLNPQKMMDPSAEEVHGLSNDFLKDQPLFKEIVEDFLEFISEIKFLEPMLRGFGKGNLWLVKSILKPSLQNTSAYLYCVGTRGFKTLLFFLNSFFLSDLSLLILLTL